jgi:hypothetical protein
MSPPTPLVSGPPDAPSYGMAKAAVVALTRTVTNALHPSDLATPEQHPVTVAPLVVYLASPAASYVTVRVFGSYGYQYVRWSEPTHEAVLESDGPWDLDRLFKQFPRTLGKGLGPGRDLRYPLPALNDGYRAPPPTVRPRY